MQSYVLCGQFGMAVPQAECVQHGLRTIAFCHTRKMCELVMAYTRETLKATAPHLSDTISVYRAGYSPAVGPLDPALFAPPHDSCAFLSPNSASLPSLLRQY